MNYSLLKYSLKCYIYFQKLCSQREKGLNVYINVLKTPFSKNGDGFKAQILIFNSPMNIKNRNLAVELIFLYFNPELSFEKPLPRQI